MTKKVTGTEELRRIGDAIDESILNASSEELREELAAQGLDVAKVVAEMDAMTARAKAAGAKMRLEEAKRQLQSFKAGVSNVSPFDREVARRLLQKMKSGGSESSPVMMAARKGKGLSQSDEEGVLDDLAQLQALDDEESGTDEE